MDTPIVFATKIINKKVVALKQAQILFSHYLSKKNEKKILSILGIYMQTTLP